MLSADRTLGNVVKRSNGTLCEGPVLFALFFATTLAFALLTGLSLRDMIVLLHFVHLRAVMLKEGFPLRGDGTGGGEYDCSLDGAASRILSLSVGRSLS